MVLLKEKFLSGGFEHPPVLAPEMDYFLDQFQADTMQILTDLGLPLSTSVYPLSTQVDSLWLPPSTSVSLGTLTLSTHARLIWAHLIYGSLFVSQTMSTLVYLGLRVDTGKLDRSVYPVSTPVDRPSVYWGLERSVSLLSELLLCSSGPNHGTELFKSAPLSLPKFWGNSPEV
ncbi:hypothetical protein DFH07DRAFT_780291 [Mycena maculata]|uniref:Uncharacterized protein n=1 Tax=Mycena maculata TaxID=230809 RepID=A0AAD7MX16_9AGAR|nr:hypothetical protein DFH07DRAFT_780291 [Mycena maculata]